VSGADRAMDVDEGGVDEPDIERGHEGAERRAQHRDQVFCGDARGSGGRSSVLPGLREGLLDFK
jgi:hypothetical protein